jgi:hypothetical protein
MSDKRSVNSVEYLRNQRSSDLIVSVIRGINRPDTKYNNQNKTLTTRKATDAAVVMLPSAS